MAMFRSVLIANRGEIALRVARTCERIGVDPVMIYTDLDRGSPHTNFEYVHRVDSYLDVDSVLEAVRTSRAEAVHPGYGFLSENAAFARAVIEAGVAWIGPPVAAMEAMARKDAARQIAVAAGVPVGAARRHRRVTGPGQGRGGRWWQGHADRARRRRVR